MSACLRFTRRVWKSFIDNKGHDGLCFPNLEIRRALPGTVETSLKIEPYNLNRVGTVHGGLIMSLTDTLGSLAVASRGHYMTGVSTDIGASFIKPAGRGGDVLHARAIVTAMGKSLAYTRVDFTNPTGDLVAYGHHTKYVGRSSSDPNNVKFSEDGETIIEGKDVD
ncbi:thioesterase thiol ester dehydrase-isomerase [Coniophora puteana RWD-64-598 SS2]|uniref:Thioesterase thiol ester dehydrase-isomerase n=1 Tax=Coniophora puteana (strain RWD-64-598) TaxID=741705 RepID=A0A5M3MQI0_CONPW|nr:thioesterase thiol ester dehydrase-isomerase [Coniophora puteana RWD-64-598 SS2]EIW81433.1 thioesterase thiol ester dehydrase-isomerase [Coniophora puteana RWD-64-598 SS2]